MCWSMSVSVGMVGLGAAATVYGHRSGVPKVVWVSLAFFTFMEALQAAGYLVINQCGTIANQAITLLSYLHIAIQPLFINALALALIPAEISRRVAPVAYALCALSSLFMVAQLLVPYEIAGHCRIGECMCAPTLCTRSGDWHIAWDIPYNGLGTWIEDHLGGVNWGMPTYMFTVFVVPALYGSWRFTLFQLLLGPVFGNLVTTDNNEVPAIWCLFSIGIVIIAFFPPSFEWFKVRRWPLWPQSWIQAPAAEASS